MKNPYDLVACLTPPLLSKEMTDVKPRKKKGDDGGSGSGARFKKKGRHRGSFKKQFLQQHEATASKAAAQVEKSASVGKPVGRESLARQRIAAVNLGRAASKGRAYTVTVALPGSIVSNAQTRELKTYLVGEIARALTVFSVDEIVVYNDNPDSSDGGAVKATGVNSFLSRILQYVETPQYLRKALFPMHPDLRLAGLLNPLDAPHHLRLKEKSRFREGVVLPKGANQLKEGQVWVNVGLGPGSEVIVATDIEPNTRVTVDLGVPSSSSTAEQPSASNVPVRRRKALRGKAVRPSVPREELGTYWGYSVRYAAALSDVWSEAPHKGGYDLCIGTSERGDVSVDDEGFSFPPFRHLLIVMGGVKGLEDAVEGDIGLQVGREQTKDLFDLYVNTCPSQGSRTIRTEEALLISLAAFRPLIEKSGKREKKKKKKKKKSKSR